MSKRINANVTSDVRAGAVSLISFAANLCAAVTMYFFGSLAEEVSIFAASLIITVLMLSIGFALFRDRKVSVKALPQS